ncbi:hypothetical protein F5Y01DRAFT_265535 [Xylaria sp. FL0043]|nr:hypothetical protein F5Y01DRAFT_265535 [Xylaria sp. FL0043]
MCGLLRRYPTQLFAGLGLMLELVDLCLGVYRDTKNPSQSQINVKRFDGRVFRFIFRPNASTLRASTCFQQIGW